MPSTLTGPDTGFAALLSAVANRDGATPDLATRPDGSSEGIRTHTSRCYSLQLDDLDDVELSSPSELLARDALAVAELPPGVSIVEGRDLSIPLGFMHH